MKTIKIDQWIGLWSGYTDKATEILSQEDCLVEFKFNGVTATVSKDTDLELLWRDLQNAHTMGFKTIGPDCKVKLSKEELGALKAREKQLKKESDERHRQYLLKEQKQKKEFEEKVGDSPLMTIHTGIWIDYVDKNQDAYGKCAVDYARDWGRLMQYYITKGETLIQCAERASFELSWYGITGFMYGAAVQMLSQTWKYGEELRKWHNKEYDHEGDGVVNPAIFTLK